MRIFLSWSKSESQQLATIFNDWLPNVLQYAETYMSSKDIVLGERWNDSIKENLEESIFGLIFVTPENIDSPWINFEAGALSKTIESKVVPILYKTEVMLLNEGPLKQFQSSKNLEKDNIYELIKSINSSSKSDKLDEGRLKSSFEMWWPSLDESIGKITKKTEKKNKILDKEPSEKELLSVIYTKLKEQERYLSINSKSNANRAYINNDVVRDVENAFKLLTICKSELEGGPFSEELFANIDMGLERLARAVRYLDRRSVPGNKRTRIEQVDMLNE